jgi:hypothetical protein
MARERGVTYVKLDGDVGILGNGAGLVMSTLDVVALAGGRPANFLDVGGGAKADKVAAALRIILSDPNVKAVLFNIFGGITRCDEVARGILQALEEVPTAVPMVVRLVGTNYEEGRVILAEAKMATAETLAEAAPRLREHHEIEDRHAFQAFVARPGRLVWHHHAENVRHLPGPERHDGLEPEFETAIVDSVERRAEVIDEVERHQRRGGVGRLSAQFIRVTGGGRRLRGGRRCRRLARGCRPRPLAVASRSGALRQRRAAQQARDPGRNRDLFHHHRSHPARAVRPSPQKAMISRKRHMSPLEPSPSAKILPQPATTDSGRRI